MIIILLFIVKPQNLKSSNLKNDSTNYLITAYYHQGAVLYDDISKLYLINDFSRGGEINIIRRRYQSVVWESEFNNLEIGTGVWFGTFGNKNIFGEGFVLKTFANYNIFRYQQFSAQYNLSFGPAFVTKIFDKEHNLFDDSFSTRLNAYSCFGFILNYQVNNRLSLSANYLFHHISNGSFSKPNNGVSILNAGFGAKYNLSSAKQVEQKYFGKTPYSKREFLCTFGMGANQVLILNSKKYISGSASLAHLWYTNRTKSYGIGADFIQFGGAPYVFKNVDEIDNYVTFKTSDYFYMGLFGIMESHLGSTAPFIAVGAYIYYKTEPRQPLYARIGLRQKIVGNLSAHFSIKLNFFSSEFMEFGLAYRIKN